MAIENKLYFRESGNAVQILHVLNQDKKDIREGTVLIDLIMLKGVKDAPRIETDVEFGDFPDEGGTGNGVITPINKLQSHGFKKIFDSLFGSN